MPHDTMPFAIPYDDKKHGVNQHYLSAYSVISVVGFTEATYAFHIEVVGNGCTCNQTEVILP
jgi:hypothetical protein